MKKIVPIVTMALSGFSFVAEATFSAEEYFGQKYKTYVVQCELLGKYRERGLITKEKDESVLNKVSSDLKLAENHLLDEVKKVETDLKAQFARESAEYESVKSDYATMEQNEKNCWNIVAKYTNAHLYRDAVKPKMEESFYKIAGTYYHNFFRLEHGIDWVIYECKHRTYDSFQNHVYWIQKARAVYDNLMNMKKPESPFTDENIMKPLVDGLFIEFDKKIERILFPIKNLVKDRQNAILESNLSKIATFECTEKNGNKKCKSSKMCKLYVQDSTFKGIGISCNCGHSLQSHKFKMKNKNETNEVLSRLYKYEI